MTDNTDYGALSDEELISLYREGSKEAAEFLVQKYKDLALKKARTMFILGGESEDLIQEGMIGLFKALRDYDRGRDASFATFAALCVSRQMYTAVQASGRKKHMPLNTAVSLNDPLGSHGGRMDDDSDDRPELEEALSEESGTLFSGNYGTNPEKVMIDRENLDRLQARIETELSPLEKQVLDLHLTGMNYIEIARILNREEKSTDNALQRIRAKVRSWKQEG